MPKAVESFPGTQSSSTEKNSSPPKNLTSGASNGSVKFPHLKLNISNFSPYHPHVLQIVFNEISAGEISRLDTLAQLELLDAFKVSQETLQNMDGEKFGKIERGGTSLYRFRAGEYRVYFEVLDENVIVHRVLHKNTFSDLLFRTKLPVGEDEELGKSKHFWKLIEEGKNAQRQ